MPPRCTSNRDSCSQQNNRSKHRQTVMQLTEETAQPPLNQPSPHSFNQPPTKPLSRPPSCPPLNQLGPYPAADDQPQNPPPAHSTHTHTHLEVDNAGLLIQRAQRGVLHNRGHLQLTIWRVWHVEGKREQASQPSSTQDRVRTWQHNTQHVDRRCTKH